MREAKQTLKIEKDSKEKDESEEIEKKTTNKQKS